MPPADQRQLAVEQPACIQSNTEIGGSVFSAKVFHFLSLRGQPGAHEAMAAHVDTPIFRIESFGKRTKARVAFLRLPALARNPSLNPAIGPERRTFDFPDLTRCHEAMAAHVETPIFRASNHSE
jgi:hypothetical protein